MRGLSKQKQDLWFCTFTEGVGAVDTVRTYSKPEKHRFSVSKPINKYGIHLNGNGVTCEYERTIAVFDKNFHPRVDTFVFVDVVPVLDEDGYLKKELRTEKKANGELLLGADGDPIVREVYVTEPDYYISKELVTSHCECARYGIKGIR